MGNDRLQLFVKKAGEMALGNVWGENAYKINMAILGMDQNNCAAYTRLAKYYKMNSNVEEAKNMYLKVLDIEPANRGALNNIMDIEKDQRESDRIEKLKSTGELLKEGNSSMLKGRYKYAVKVYSKAYGMEPSLNFAVNLASAYKKAGRQDMVEQLYQKLIDENSKEADASVISKEFRILLVKEMSIVD